MLSLVAAEPINRVLVIGCHADDIEIGCGGTILALTRAEDVEVDWVVLSASARRVDEAQSSAEAFLTRAKTARIEIHNFRDGFLPYSGAEVKERFEELKARVDPQIVFTHTRADLHQDHRFACELTWNTFRSHLILEYEIPKVDGDIGTPNCFVPLTREIAETKVELLEQHFASQAAKHWFDRDLFMGMMRIRGMEAVAPERLAEAFIARKTNLLFAPT